MVKTLLTCTCLGTQDIDPAALAESSGLTVPRPCQALCTTQIETAAKALATGDVMIACQQEARTFQELADEIDAPAPALVDLRDRAGWSADSATKTPKMAALLAEALLPAEGGAAVDVVSEGICLIVGDGPVALAAAETLAPFLTVTALVPAGSDLPDTRDFDIVVGQLRQAQGALGGFNVVIDQLQQADPGGRGTRSLSEPRDGGRSACDIILDLRGGQPLFPAHEKREGYLRADPGHAPSVAKVVMEASHLVGTFEKPLYVRTQPILCAHSRAEQTGCTRCLDLCPTGAILPDGDHVTIDPMICAGCGACSSACPSGAVSYDAPPVDMTMRRAQVLAQSYLSAGGKTPHLLVHDAHGAEMIRLLARHGDGLPAHVIPLEIPAIGAFGHAEITAARAAGFQAVTLLPGPGADRDALAAQLALAQAICRAEGLSLADITDPDALPEALAQGMAAAVAQPVRPMGTRRQITRQAAKALHADTTPLPLPDGAPYGAIVVDKSACTLCLSCVSLCPSGALGDNPDKPQLRFQEDACLQCGICATICPEEAITLQPQLDLADSALRQEVLNEEEPFACVDCGTLFGSRSAIERITEKLQGHSMFSSPERLRMIQMCDDCRVNAQMHAENNPFTSAPRPKPRTTEDYLSKRRDH